jgi:hypothetical protein
MEPDPFADYDPGRYFCELTEGLRDGDARAITLVRERIATIGLDQLRARAAAAEDELINLGITFTVYSDATAIDRILPFDCVPRIIMPGEWRTMEAGVRQRVAALNAFLHDVYHERRIIADGILPADLVLGNANYRPEMEGFPVRFGTYVHVCGIDIVRDEQGAFRVLEDNARTPSGVSYVIENRHLMLRAFPDVTAGMKLRPVDDYGRRLRSAMCEVAPEGVDDPQVVLLSPGIYNSAYFEHVFLAREMGVPLVEGADLVVEDGRVFMRTTGGLEPVHTIYRRIGRVAARQRDVGQRRRDWSGGRQGDLRLHASYHKILPRRGCDPGQRRDPYLPGARGSGLHLGPAGKPGYQAGGRERWLRHHDRTARQQGGAGGRARRADRRPGELDQPAGDRAVGRADAHRPGAAPAPSGPSAFRDHGPRHMGVAGRPVPRGAA